MAKKKRSSSDRRPVPAGIAELAAPGIPSSGGAVPIGTAAKAEPEPRAQSLAMPAEVVRGDWTAVLFAIMMFLAPAIGVPHEEMLQDTLKSIVVAFAAIGAALIFFWQQRQRRDALRWHGIVWLPLMLMAYALGSMVWSHTYLGGVEAIRWFIFSLIVWLSLNTFSRERLPLIAMGIHVGAVTCSLWAALQFWFDFKYFPQGPNPASTFVNRNFFAEYVVCALPFSMLLLGRARQSAQIALLAFTTAFVIVAILMTGTRGALGAMWVQLLVVIPLIAFLYRHEIGFPTWDLRKKALAASVLIGTVLVLGLIKTGNSNIVQEERGVTPIERGLKRTQAIRPDDGSLGVRLIMWKATATIIQKRPFSGVGAGAWESDIPLYQAEGSQLETDYYVHNEFLQLLAEYGLVGWVVLAALFAYLIQCAWRTMRASSPEARAEAPFRAVFLCALLALLIVSNVGFPWRMASTGALFAVCLGTLAASDVRLGLRAFWGPRRLAWTPVRSQVALVAAVVCLGLAAYITQKAAECEEKIVKAAKLALTVSASGDYNSPRWDRTKADMLRLIKEGTDINPHYRKITPMVADELAKWGDWKNAVWVWESVLSSRPYVVAIISNVARGHLAMGNNEKSMEALERAVKIQPNAPAVRSLEVVLLSRMGNEKKAVERAREAIGRGIYDFDLVNAAFVLGWRSGDYDLATKAMDLRIKDWPAQNLQAYMQLGSMYTTGKPDEAKALEAFRKALEMAPEIQRPLIAQQIPSQYWSKLGLGGSMPRVLTQTSVISR